MGLTLPEEGPIYLDANGFIYSVEKIEPYCDLLAPLWEAAQGGRFEIVSSELTLLEVLVKPLKENDTVLADLFRALLRAREVRLIPVTIKIWEQAATLRARIPKLRTPDALHAATAAVAGSKLFLTNDPGFRQVPGLSVTTLDSALSALQ